MMMTKPGYFDTQLIKSHSDLCMVMNFNNKIVNVDLKKQVFTAQ